MAGLQIKGSTSLLQFQLKEIQNRALGYQKIILNTRRNEKIRSIRKVIKGKYSILSNAMLNLENHLQYFQPSSDQKSQDRALMHAKELW